MLEMKKKTEGKFVEKWSDTLGNGVMSKRGYYVVCYNYNVYLLFLINA